MPVGWIDFSKNERNKVLSVLDLLSESGTLDELGTAPVRDGFADLFFPGTSTIQTRAKYFLIVPYILKDLEREKESNPNRLQSMLNEKEKECALRLLEKEPDTSGIIGSRSLSQGGWVKRTPASIYWSGLRSYGIFTGGGLSLPEYLRAVCALKSQKANLRKLGNRNDNTADDDRETDDSDAGGLFHRQFWSVPTYIPEWMNHLTLRLTEEEGAYLKHQIIMTHPDSMLAYILKNNMDYVPAVERFRDLGNLMRVFPEEIQQNYALAYAFSEFLFVLRIQYNLILSNGENRRANSEWENVQDHLREYAEIDLESIIRKLFLQRNPGLCYFLRRARDCMKTENVDDLKDLIRKREKDLKQSRAKTQHPGEFNPDEWYGGEYLDYRFNNVKTIIRDIFESGGKHV